MKIIDPHLHLFNLLHGDYQWLKTDNPPFWPDKNVINKAFNEQDLQLHPPLELKGFVHIEAGFNNQEPWREIAWLEGSCSLPFKSIGGINLQLTSNDFQQALDKLCQYKSVVGVRDILDENALKYLSSIQVQENLSQLDKRQLVFECQMPLSNVETTAHLVEIIEKLPTLNIVINHAGWPPENINSEAWIKWQENIKTISNYNNVTIKCSGFEMTNRQYSANWQQQVVECCVTSFGFNRTMLASNFPLCLFRDCYQKSWLTYQKAPWLSEKELELLCYINAFNTYKFGN